MLILTKYWDAPLIVSGVKSSVPLFNCVGVPLNVQALYVPLPHVQVDPLRMEAPPVVAAFNAKLATLALHSTLTTVIVAPVRLEQIPSSVLSVASVMELVPTEPTPNSHGCTACGPVGPTAPCGPTPPLVMTTRPTCGALNVATS